MAGKNIDSIYFNEIDLEDVGRLRGEVFPDIFEKIEAQEKINNDLVEEIDIVKSENAELARNQRYLAELLGKLILSLLESGGGVKITDGNVMIHPSPDFELVWEESDLLVAMTKFKTGRQVLMELLGTKYEVQNWPQLRQVPNEEGGSDLEN